MRVSLLLVIIILSGCRNKIRVSGVVLEAGTLTPLNGVVVKTLKNINNNQFEYAQTKTRDGMFILEFSSPTLNTNKILVELSKNKYAAKSYYCYRDRLNDTLYLSRAYH